MDQYSIRREEPVQKERPKDGPRELAKCFGWGFLILLLSLLALANPTRAEQILIYLLNAYNAFELLA